ncbi:MAG TPA: DUF368 domain-containing protein [Firmicutes bacterium]|nr:DUF368 domain-containing protein [Bacillota bacterium]
MNFFIYMFMGVVIGVANIIPGVSGGTMAVVMGVYDDLINAVGNLKKEFKKSVLFLIPIALGAGLGIVLLSKAITWLLQRYPMPVNFFFLGLIAGSIPMIWQKALGRDQQKTASESLYKSGAKSRIAHLIAFIAGAAVMLITTFFSPADTGTVFTQLTLPLFIRLVLVSMIAAIAMIIPGVSGSFMMVLLGTYYTVTAAISSFNIPILIPVAIGVLLGLLGGAKGIQILLRKYPQTTYFAILGLVAGSVFGIWPGWTANLQGIISIGMLAVGAIIAYVLGSDWIHAFFLSRKTAEKKS